MLDAARAQAVAESLGLQLWSFPVCAACLSIVAFELEHGDEPAIRDAVRWVAPNLWAEGLEPVVRQALVRAAAAGVPDAEAALRDVRRYAYACRVVKAVIRDLAAQQLEEIRTLRLPPLNGSRTRRPLGRA